MYKLIWGIVADSHGIDSSQVEEFFKCRLGGDICITKNFSKGSLKVEKSFDNVNAAKATVERVTSAYPRQAFWKNIDYDRQDLVDENGDAVYCEDCGDAALDCECKSRPVKNVAR